MNNIIYFDKPLYFSEALYLLDKFANNIQIECNDLNILRDDVDINEYLKIINSIKEENNFNSLYLFKHLNSSKLSIANCLCCHLNAFELEKEDAKDKLLANIKNIINSKVNDINITNCIEILPGDSDRFIDRMLNLNISSDIKINILKELFKPEISINLIFDDIYKIIPKLKELFNIYNNDYKSNYTKEYINDLIGENYVGDEKLIVVPYLSSPTNITLNIHDENELNVIPSSLHIGILIDHEKLKNDNLSDNRLEEYFEYFTKVLNDKSKMNIVDLLKKQEMYGAQIAQALNLKTPTVSHHMVTLLNSGIVSANRVNNCIIYSYNKEKCLEMIEYLKTKLI